MEEAVWYFDGSMLNGKWLPLRATGFGIAAVARDGQLLACGRGSPPHWCATAAAAEAWALLQVLRLLPFPPEMRTDCQALLHTIHGTTQDAGAANRQLARIWRDIANILDGCFKPLADAQQLVWMPAHTDTAAVGEVKLSNGGKLTMVDWRANRLVDALAKMSALEAQDLHEAVRLIKSSETAVRYAASLLGRTTHAANNHAIVVTDENGKECNKVVRDAMPAPRRIKRRLSPSGAKPVCKQATTTLPQNSGADLPPPRKAPSLCPSSDKPWQVAKKLESERLRQRVEEIGSSLSTSVGKIPASDRITALRQRIASRPCSAHQ